MTVFYNEFDPFAADWLQNLSDGGMIPAGTIDRRSITEVSAKDVEGYTQQHYFAGIGGWPEAFRLAGIGADVNAWSGSCPCQPFSAAGKQKGQADARHLWPEMLRLIKGGRPEWIFGEQVSAAIGHGWIDGVQADLESEGYAFGYLVCGAHSIGAPHIRQRIWWGAKRVFDSHLDGSQSGRIATEAARHRDTADSAGRGVLNASTQRLPIGVMHGGVPGVAGFGDQGEASFVASNAWSDYTIGQFRDGKSRRIGRGIQPLAHGIPRNMGRGEPELRSLLRIASTTRVGRLKGYGNAIVPGLAALFIRAFMESTQTQPGDGQ
jgi:DNA (cytosine-5)-methyltransferase 1